MIEIEINKDFKEKCKQFSRACQSFLYPKQNNFIGSELTSISGKDHTEVFKFAKSRGSNFNDLRIDVFMGQIESDLSNNKIDELKNYLCTYIPVNIDLISDIINNLKSKEMPLILISNKNEIINYIEKIALIG